MPEPSPAVNVDSAAELCLEPMSEGHCTEYVLLWYYYALSGECRPFVYGGCGGNGNRFSSKQDCQSTCILVNNLSRASVQQGRIMWLARTLLALALLCAPVSSLCLPTYDPEPNFLCNNEVFSKANDKGQPTNSLLDSVNLLFKSAHALSSEEPRERRTTPASKYRYLSQTQLRSKLYRNSAKSDRRSQVTLSLDVPTNIMNILFNIAKAKNLRAKADDNARLLAQIGKRK